MRLLVHSYFPPLRSHLAGGAQQFVHDLLMSLAGVCEQVTVLCPAAEGQEVIDLGPRGIIDPALIEPGARPLAPYERLWNARAFARRTALADVVLSIDRGAPAQVDKPVVLCLNALSYGTEVDALFGLAWDEIVVPSDYMLRSLTALFGPGSWSGEPRPVHCIPYSIDVEHFRPRDPAPLLDQLGLDPARQYVLFPHRPDPRKGFSVAFAAVQRAHEQDPRLQLLVPHPPQSVKAVRADQEKCLAGFQAEVRKRAIGDAVKFHPWIDLADLPAYFSLGSVTLALSSLPESFGLTPVQSVSCHTPVITTPAGAVPGLLPPEHGISLVPFNDPAAVARALTDLPTDAAVEAGRRYVSSAYSPRRAAEAYLAVLRAARRRESRFTPCEGDLVRPPWCHPLPGGAIWHDYEGVEVDPAPAGISLAELQQQGLLVPVASACVPGQPGNKDVVPASRPAHRPTLQGH